MRKPVRRIIVLLAAYVVALQALLLPLTVAHAAWTDSLCVSSASEAGRQPAGHETPCACAAGCGIQCGVQLMAVPPPSAVVPLPRSESVFAPTPAIQAAVAAVANGLPSARAPPSA